MTLRAVFSEWFEPSEEEFERLWINGAVAPDANVLLTPYRVGEQSAHALFSAFEYVGNRLVVPHRACVEFMENRLSVITDQQKRFVELRQEFGSLKKKFPSVRTDHPSIPVKDLRDQYQSMFQQMERQLDAWETTNPVADFVGASDPYLERWNEIVGDRITQPLACDDDFRAEADRRFEEGVPPGFKDKNKDGERDPHGDLILWREVLAAARAADSKELMLVTNDTKEDWWRRFSGKTIGPRQELVREARAAGIEVFWMYSSEQFVERANQRRGIESDPRIQRDLRDTVRHSATSALEDILGVDNRAARALLAERIRSLPEKERLVVALRYYEELSFEEIATILALPVEAVHGLHRAAIWGLRRPQSEAELDQAPD